MKKTLVIILALGALSAPLSLAAQTSSGLSTGDNALDESLAVIDRQAAGGTDAFYAKLSAQFGASVAEIKALAAADKLSPEEVYLALALAKQTGGALTDVAKAVAAGEGKAWGVIALKLGIKPGSDAFKELRDGALKEADVVGDKDSGRDAPDPERSKTGPMESDKSAPRAEKSDSSGSGD